MQLAYLPDRKRDYLNDDDGGSCASGVSVDGRDDVVNLDDLVKDMRSNKKRGMLGWFKIRVIFSSFIFTSFNHLLFVCKRIRIQVY